MNYAELRAPALRTFFKLADRWSLSDDEQLKLLGLEEMSVLKAWSAGDPPDAFEKRRNQVIYDTWQHNRNPFVDHPEWVTSIWP